MNESKDKWNQRYKEKLNSGKVHSINGRLKNLEHYFVNGGKALDFACGLGQNSLFLAEKGYTVQAVDISDVAIKYLQEKAREKQLDVVGRVEDLTVRSSLNFSENSFDLIITTNYLDRDILPYLQAAVRESGLFFMETFYQQDKYLHGVSERYQLTSQELLTEFTGWQILYYEENEQEGRQTVFCRKK